MACKSAKHAFIKLLSCTLPSETRLQHRGTRWLHCSSFARHADDPSAWSRAVSFPSQAAGGVIRGPLGPSASARRYEEALKKEQAAIFDNYYQESNERTGRKEMRRAIKGPKIIDYYLTKNMDPLMTNLEHYDKMGPIWEKNRQGFFQRRPTKGGSKKGRKK